MKVELALTISIEVRLDIDELLLDPADEDSGKTAAATKLIDKHDEIVVALMMDVGLTVMRVEVVWVVAMYDLRPIRIVR